MLSISKAKTAQSARRYYRDEYQNSANGEEEKLGEWRGKGAQELGLEGDLNRSEYERVLQGKHPLSEQQLVQKREAGLINQGKRVKQAQARAGWDACFSCPKSISLQAIVGGDERVIEAHKRAVERALKELEQVAQARMGGNKQAETTGKLIIAKFEHDSDRPVKDAKLGNYAAPQLHSHCFIMNMTITKEGQYRSLQPRELFKAQSYVKGVYYNSLAREVEALGYEIEQGKYREPQIKGYSKEYLHASSPRRKEIEEYLATEERGQKDWVVKTQRAALITREAKISSEDRGKMQEKHQELAARYGNQAQQLYQEALKQGPRQSQYVEQKAQEVIAKCLEKQSQKLSTEKGLELRRFLGEAYQEGIGKSTIAAINREVRHRQEQGEIAIVRNKNQLVISTRKDMSELIEAERARTAKQLKSKEELKSRVGLESKITNLFSEKLAQLGRTGQIIEIGERAKRLKQVVAEYFKEPRQSLVVTTNQPEKKILNEAIHRQEAQRATNKRVYQSHVLIEQGNRAEPSGNRTFSGYEVGQKLKYERGSKVYGIEKGTYGEVLQVNESEKYLIVKLNNGELRSYNPERLKGVKRYQGQGREFFEGERVEFQAAYPTIGVRKGELGRIIKLNEEKAEIELDRGRKVEVALKEWPHLDYGYVVESVKNKRVAYYQLLVNIQTEMRQANLGEGFKEVLSKVEPRNIKLYVDNQESIERLIDSGINEEKRTIAVTKDREIEPLSELGRKVERSLIDIYQRGIDIIPDARNSTKDLSLAEGVTNRSEAFAQNNPTFEIEEDSKALKIPELGRQELASESLSDISTSKDTSLKLGRNIGAKNKFEMGF